MYSGETRERKRKRERETVSKLYIFTDDNDFNAIFRVNMRGCCNYRRDLFAELPKVTKLDGSSVIFDAP